MAVAVYGFASFFLILGAGLFVVGAHDVALPRSTFGTAVASAMLLVTGVLLVVASWQLHRFVRRDDWKGDVRPPCHPIVLAAFLIALLFGGYAFLSAVGSPARQRFVVVGLAILIVVIASLGLVFFGRDVKLTLPKVGAAVALALFGTVFSAWEFWYQNQYVPAHAGGAVSLKVGLRQTGEDGPFDVVRATVDYEAIGGKTVAIVGSTYTLTGSKLVCRARAATVEEVAPKFEKFLLDPQRIRFMADVAEGTPRVLAAGKFVADGKRLDPEVPASRGFVFLVPQHRYQLLRFRAQLFAIPGSVRLSQRTPPEYTRLPGDNELYGYWHIDDDSWLHDVLYGRERWMVMRYELVDPGNNVDRHKPPEAAPVAHAMHVVARFPPPTWTGGRPGPEALKQLFDKQQAINALEVGDANEPFADSELPLDPVHENCGGA